VYTVRRRNVDIENRFYMELEKGREKAGKCLQISEWSEREMVMDFVASSVGTTGFHRSFQNPDVARKSLQERSRILMVSFISCLFWLHCSSLRNCPRMGGLKIAGSHQLFPAS
jgi:hypothetical protein